MKETSQTENVNKGHLLRNVWFGVQTTFRASKVFFILKCLLLLYNTFVPLVMAWLWKEILNGVMDFANSRDTVILCLTMYLALLAVSHLLNPVSNYIHWQYTDAVQFYIDGIMIDKMSHMDMAFFDSAKMKDKVRHARQSFDIMTDMVWHIFNIFSSIATLFTTFLIVWSYKWWIGLLTLVCLIPYSIYNKKHAEKLLRMKKEQLRDNRKKEFYSGVFFNNDIQFEIKLNNIGDYFINKYKEIWEKLYKINQKEKVRHSVISAFIMLLNMIGECLVIIMSVFDVLSKTIGIGDLQYNLSIVSRFRRQASNLMYSINDFTTNNIRLNELQEFMEIQPIIEKSGTRQPSANPKIEFRNVYFRYPNAPDYVLEDCSFTIEPHEKIGLIGLNGAGKSTIIKLMFRFYDPEQGSILLDGIDMREYDVYAVRKIFGVLFQDYVQYCLPLREIIALSDFEERFNDEKLKNACDISGVSAIIQDWPDGYDTILGRDYTDKGKDMSGGQWQLVGLARAYFRDTEYMILDEPSAALDPIAEDRIFEQLYHLSEGKSAVTISHRLSNTTLADRILVISGGRITEQGTHFELLRQEGEYAHLFKLQAEKYV